MRLTLFLFSFALTAAAFLAPCPAKATVVEFSDSHVNVVLKHDYSYEALAPWGVGSSHTLEIGHSETIDFVDTNPESNRNHEFSFLGRLAPNSMITFSLNSSGYQDTATISIWGDYDYYTKDGIPVAKDDYYQKDGLPPPEGADHNVGEVRASSFYNPYVPQAPSESKSYINGAAVPALVFAASNIPLESSSTMTASIRNESDGALDILVNFVKTFGLGAAPSASITYEVSAVPIPATLPMFAFGLAGLAGLRSRKMRLS